MGSSRRVLPSHMKKTLDRLDQVIHTVDMIVELVDARAPRTTRSPLLKRALGGRRPAIALTKADLADPAVTRRWGRHFQSQGLQTFSFSAVGNPKIAREKLLRIARARIRDAGDRGEFKLFVVGIPNIGKSTFLNVLAGKKRAHVGAKPGVTRGLQYLRLDEGVLLVDTPGVIALGQDDLEKNVKLALVGAVQEGSMDYEATALYLLERSLRDDPRPLEARYGVSTEKNEGREFFEALARKRGFLLPGGAADLERAMRLATMEYIKGVWSGLSLEDPDDREEPEEP